ncbi:protein DMP2-like [Panicum virgatum]|uniref:Uncharacterized protein n=1 Tax=Panicum virgatum TaxID=38727 RepID=A0A8T0SPR1_PANVG|nr:protein DMP2-like [Panicum virgatum]KAG2598983.1 hypothetical protein PVAP13_5KG375100 [Panicum virgatum]
MAAAATSSGGDVRIPIPSTTATTTPDAIRESSTAPSPVRGDDGASTPPRRLKAPAALPADAMAPPPTAIDRTLASVANLAKLLPTGTALAFQSLSPSFTNRGACLPSNRYLTAALLYLCVLSCVFFSFTDSFVGGDGKLYYGLATVKGFLVFNYTGDTGNDEEDAERRRQVFKNLRGLRIRWVDYVHAVFSAVVFLTVAFSNAAVQSCFFPTSGDNVDQMLTNLPLGAGFFSTMVFLVFPTTRKGIDHTGPFRDV